MAQILPIIELGHSCLRQQAQEIVNIQETWVQELIEDMLVTVKNANGAGIAAPQVNKSYRIFIVASRPSSRYPDAPEVSPFAVINPQILSHSEEIEKRWEGCLSIPGVRGCVPRYQKIETQYFDREGKCIHQEFTGFLARVFQHEYDHLEGIVFFDRLETTHDIMTENQYKIQNNL